MLRATHLVHSLTSRLTRLLGPFGHDVTHELGIVLELLRPTPHARDFLDRRGFTYTVLDVSDDVVGCVYVYPADDGVHDATVQSWVRESEAALDGSFRRAIADWISSDAWPFERPLYEPLLG